MSMIRTGVRYGRNRVAMVARYEGAAAAAVAGLRFAATEARTLPRWVDLAWRVRRGRWRPAAHPPMYSDTILRSLKQLSATFHETDLDAEAFRAHCAGAGYPRNYAAGPIAEGGMREQKLLEYFVSLELLSAHTDGVVIDVASEWSLFPEVLRERTGAAVYRQDLIYPPGIHGRRIGGSAAAMAVPAGFADALVLHNAFEHFEGSTDTGFVVEAGRVLRPGGVLLILPLFLSEQHCILSDPLVERRGVAWDPGARVVELPWWHNRFGRFYDAAALERRVLAPARAAGFEVAVHHFANVRDLHPGLYLHFALALRKAAAGDRGLTSRAAAAGSAPGHAA